MTLSTEFQHIATGQTVSFNGAYGCLELWAKYNSQSIENNTTNYTAEIRLVVWNGYIGEYQGTWFCLYGTGLPAAEYSKGTASFTSQTLGSTTGNVTHSDNGSKYVDMSGSISFSAWGKSLSVSGGADLPSIPRYANFTRHEITGTTEHNVTVNWWSDASCDAVQYSLNGGAWTDTSGTTYTVGNLKPGATYSIRTKIRRGDSRLWRESGTLSFTTKDCVVNKKIDGTWKKCVPYIKINGNWKKAIPYRNINGTWKEGIN